MNILKLAEDYEDIHFILSKDTKMSPNFMKKHGIPERAKKCIEYVIPDKKYEIGKVTVKTLRSTDAGLCTKHLDAQHLPILIDELHIVVRKLSLGDP